VEVDWSWLTTTGLAGVGAAGVFLSEWRRRRDRPTAAWNLRTKRGDHGSLDVTLTNMGDAAARGVHVEGEGCIVHRGRAGPPFPTMAPGESHEFEVTVLAGGRAYVRIRCTTGPPRRSWHEVAWLHLGEDGAAWLEEFERQGRQLWWRRLTWPRVRKRFAGPGGVKHMQRRATAREKRLMQRAIDMADSGLPDIPSEWPQRDDGAAG
jgi:hypothetical protein